MKYIDITPTWAAAVEVYMLVLTEGSESGKVTARQELRRLAQMVDAHMAKGRR